MRENLSPGQASPPAPGAFLLEEQVSLAPYTTIKIGGPARYFTRVETPAQLQEALQWASSTGTAPFILGGGSNLLVADAGWPGLIIKNAIPGITFEDADGAVMAIAGGGVDWDAIVAATVEQNLQGLECLSGIPGTVGAAPVQNIGAYGQEVKDTIAWVEALDRRGGEVIRIPGAECDFAYRWSRFKGADKDRYVVTRVAFRLQKDAPATLRYGDVTRYFDERQITAPTLPQVRDAVLEIRRAKGMVVDPAMADSRSCGSFMMNPIVAEAHGATVEQIARERGSLGPAETMPRYAAGTGQVKLSAAWLMERAGLKKGEKLGNVGLSSRHVLAIINGGQGTAEEVLALVRRIQQVVYAEFQVRLVPEPVFVGFPAEITKEIYHG